MSTKRRSSKNQERFRRTAKRNRRSFTVEAVVGPPVGPNVVTASLEEVLAAIKEVPPDLDWAALADRIVPILPRMRPSPFPAPEPLRILVPPGLSVGFGIDLGPAFMNVTQDLLDRWALSAADLMIQALKNLAHRIDLAAAAPVIRESIAGVPVQALQSGTGCASTFVLVPDSIGRIFGSAPQLLIAPMRDLLFSFPVDVDRDLVTDLYDDVASQDPNCLAPIAFIFREGTIALEPLGEAFAMA